MRLTLAMFGLELDITFGPTAPEPEFNEFQDAGTTSTYAVGFTLPDVPMELDCPHVFEPDEPDD